MAQSLPTPPPTFKTFVLSYGPNENFALHSVCASAKLFVGFWAAYKPGDFESKSFAVTLWDTDDQGTPVSSNWKSASCPIKYRLEYEENIDYFLRNAQALFDEERRYCSPNLVAAASKPKKQATPYVLPTSGFFGAGSANNNNNGFGAGQNTGAVRRAPAEHAVVTTNELGSAFISATPFEPTAPADSINDTTDHIHSIVRDVARGRPLDSRTVVVPKRTITAAFHVGPDEAIDVSDGEQRTGPKLSSSWLCTASGTSSGAAKPGKAGTTAAKKRGPAKPKPKPAKAPKSKPAAKRQKKLPSSDEEESDGEERGEELVSEDEHSSWYGSPTRSDKEFIEDDQPSSSQRK